MSRNYAVVVHLASSLPRLFVAGGVMESAVLGWEGSEWAVGGAEV